MAACFVSQVVFSEGWWIGSCEENPEEEQLAEPDWLAQPVVQHKFSFSGRGERWDALLACGCCCLLLFACWLCWSLLAECRMPCVA
jgi:hypothetical protein